MPTIMIIGSFSGHNFGDTAIMAATIREIDDQLGSNTRYLIPTSNPLFVSTRFRDRRIIPIDVGMRRTLSYRFLGLPVLRALRETDAIVTTAGIFFDYRLLDPRFNFVLSLLPILWHAKRSGIPIIGLNIGISRPTSRVGGMILGKAIGTHNYLSTRDQVSHELALRWVSAGNAVSASDTVHLLLSPSTSLTGRSILGINVPAYLNRFSGDSLRQLRKQEFISRFSSNLDHISREHGLTVRFIATTPSDHRLHVTLSRHMATSSQVQDLSKFTLDTGLAVFDDLSYLIASRLHACIIATSLGIPTLGLVYHEKVANYMNEVGLSPWLLPFSESMTELLLSRFRDLVCAGDSLRPELLLEQRKRSADAQSIFVRFQEVLNAGRSAVR